MNATTTIPTAPLRPAEEVMRLAVMGAAHPTRLSFMPALLRRARREAWRVSRPVWRIDANGVGVAVYRVETAGHVYSLVAFAHDLDPALRSDRVIAEAWDATFALVDGEASEADIERLAANVPRQEAGRVSAKELVLSRANRSVRLWEHVVGRLAEGRQPDAATLAPVGYLMRTTAVYGNGKFGLGDRDRIADRPELSGPFQAEMLTVWLIRDFTFDLAEHLAAARNANAARLDPARKRDLGVGNSTGLGMAPFLVRHPALIHRWALAKETALARVRALPRTDAATAEQFRALVARAALHASRWRVDDALQSERIAGLEIDLAMLGHRAAAFEREAQPWDALYRWADGALSLEGRELLVGLMLEPHGRLIDDLCETMACAERGARIEGRMSAGEMRALLADRYAWALTEDFESRSATARFWYTSEEKLEPRLGERYDEPGAERENPLAIARDAKALDLALDLALEQALAGEAPDAPLAEFLERAPEHRLMVRRAQRLAALPYAEIADNIIAAAMRPIDILRWKLAFFGASAFDPRSDRWLRISMYRGAPCNGDLDDPNVDFDDWLLPRLAP